MGKYRERLEQFIDNGDHHLNDVTSKIRLCKTALRTLFRNKKNVCS